MAGIDKIMISNMALGRLGQSGIESFDENSSGANQCKLWYDISRTQTLEGYNWSFAKKRIVAAPHSDGGTEEWMFRYQYPADCVALRLVINPLGPKAPPIPFDIEGDDAGSVRTILTNQPQAKFLYTRDVSNVSLFSNSFIESLSVKLAANTCFALTGKTDLMNGLNNLYQVSLAIAEGIDANQGVDRRKPDAPWIQANQGADETATGEWGGSTSFNSFIRGLI